MPLSPLRGQGLQHPPMTSSQEMAQRKALGKAPPPSPKTSEMPQATSLPRAPPSSLNYRWQQLRDIPPPLKGPTPFQTALMPSLTLNHSHSKSSQERQGGRRIPPTHPQMPQPVRLAGGGASVASPPGLAPAAWGVLGERLGCWASGSPGCDQGLSACPPLRLYHCAWDSGREHSVAASTSGSRTGTDMDTHRSQCVLELCFPGAHVHTEGLDPISPQLDPGHGRLPGEFRTDRETPGGPPQGSQSPSPMPWPPSPHCPHPLPLSPHLPASPGYGWVLLLLERPTQALEPESPSLLFQEGPDSLSSADCVPVGAGTQAEAPRPALRKPVCGSSPPCLPLQRAGAWPQRAHMPEAQALLLGSTPGNPGHMPTCPFKPRGPLASRLAPNSTRAEGPPPGHCDTLPCLGNPALQPRPPQLPSHQETRPGGPGTLKSRSIEARGRLAAVGHAATRSN
uniref:WAS/WASL-interacting protein family member 3-like n=1 Tax=Urocitellus parryii TaxID=9999 RepID=UPI000E55DF49|nr:WAS/WASL-interacting protein family member 3-like [Urocitellus parryii]